MITGNIIAHERLGTQAEIPQALDERKGETKMSEAARKDLPEIEEGWKCENDQDAEWCLEQIRNAEEEKAKWKAHYDAMYAGVCASCEATIANMKHFLWEYFQTVPHKAAKTEENYRLPGGKLVLKKQEPEYQRDDAEVMRWLREHGGLKYIKTKDSLDWSGLKKTLTVVGETVADENGEIIPCIRAVEQPDVFTIGK